MATYTLDNSSGELAAILDTVNRIGGFQTTDPDSDFYDAGLTSVMALPLLLELETQFGVSIPDDRFISARTARDLQQIIFDLRKG
jgi:acyl carrier protein